MEPIARITEFMMLAPQAVTNGATVTANLDTSGGGVLANARALHADISVDLAAQVNTNAVTPTVKILESDDTVVTNFATITAQLNPTMTAAGKLRFLIDLRAPRKRWLRVSIGIPTATNDNQTVSVTGKLHWNKEPSAAADYVGISTGGGADTNSTVTLVV